MVVVEVVVVEVVVVLTDLDPAQVGVFVVQALMDLTEGPFAEGREDLVPVRDVVPALHLVVAALAVVAAVVGQPRHGRLGRGLGLRVA